MTEFNFNNVLKEGDRLSAIVDFFSDMLRLHLIRLPSERKRLNGADDRNGDGCIMSTDTCKKATKLFWHHYRQTMLLLLNLKQKNYIWNNLLRFCISFLLNKWVSNTFAVGVTLVLTEDHQKYIEHVSTTSNFDTTKSKKR